jgi:CRP-like cAMP-binding protein
MYEAYINQLSGHRLFYGIAKEDMEHLLGCLGVYEKHYKKSQFVMMQEEALKSVGFILKGRVHMVKEDLWGNSTILAVMKEKDIFGEAFVCGSSMITTVACQAAEDSTILFLPFHRIMHTCTHVCGFHQRLIENMVTLIADKNVSLMEKIEITSKKTIKEKIAVYLTNQSLRAESKYFTIPLGRIELAEYLCTDRSALTRVLNNMKEQGLIDYERNTFRLLKELQ